MGPNRSLLLVNGRRVADYPLPYGGETNFSNYGNIPAAAVERIEVLTGGASAIYGSDAIAGVVNVILKPTTTATKCACAAAPPPKADVIPGICPGPAARPATTGA
jgi:outer membrane receptor for ferrienterochelin and colicin